MESDIAGLQRVADELTLIMNRPTGRFMSTCIRWSVHRNGPNDNEEATDAERHLFRGKR